MKEKVRDLLFGKSENQPTNSSNKTQPGMVGLNQKQSILGNTPTLLLGSGVT